MDKKKKKPSKAAKYKGLEKAIEKRKRRRAAIKGWETRRKNMKK